MQRYNVQGIPHAFVVDKEGKISWQGHPAQPDLEQAVQAARNKKAKVDLKTLTRCAPACVCVCAYVCIARVNPCVCASLNVCLF